MSDDDPTAPARPKLRLAAPADTTAIDALAHAAYGDPREAALLARLRDAGALWFALVTETDAEAGGAGDASGGLTGFVAFAEAVIAPADAPAVSAAAVAGLAVARAARGRGVGLSLLRVGLQQARARGAAAALVNSDHPVFERAGFSADAAEGLDTPWAEHPVLAAALRETAADLHGAATWPEAFFAPQPAQGG